MKKSNIVCLYLNNKLSYHYTEDIPTLLRSLNATKLNVLGTFDTKEYMNDEKFHQKRMEEKKRQLDSIDQEDIDGIR